MIRRALILLTLIFPFVSAIAQTQGQSIIIDEASFAPVQTDALSGVAIDKIGKDTSQRPCARLKIHINRMTRAEIEQLSLRPVGGNVVVMKQQVAIEGNGLIVELTAKEPTRFHLHHDKYGDSNEVSLNLEGDKEYKLSAELNIAYPIFVNSDAAEAEVYIDEEFVGRTNDRFTLTVKDIMPGKHTLKIKHGTAIAEQEIEVTSDNLDFFMNVKSSKSIPQYVVFSITPKNANVIINQKSHTTDAEGVVEILLNNGTYNYQVSSAGYHTKKGIVTINGAKVTEKVTLDRAHGWVEIDATTALRGASVYIDDNLIGKVPIKSGNLASGEHKIRISKELYLPFEDTITIKDNETLKYSPSLSADFATVTLTTANGAEIYVNNKYRGTTSWTGDLQTGLYIFEARKEGHRSTTLSMEIGAKPQKQGITLDEPTPITGYLNLTTTPTMATVRIDGKDAGNSPIMMEMLIGTHTLAISKYKHKVIAQEFTIKEGETTTLSFALEKETDPAKLLISSDPGGAAVYIDKEYACHTTTAGTKTISVEAGEHQLKLSKSGYRDFTKELSLSAGETKKIGVELKPTLLTTCRRYVGFGFSASTGFGYDFSDEDSYDTNTAELCLGTTLRLGNVDGVYQLLTGFQYTISDRCELTVPAILHIKAGGEDLGACLGLGTELAFPFEKLKQPDTRYPIIVQLGAANKNIGVYYYFKGYTGGERFMFGISADYFF